MASTGRSPTTSSSRSTAQAEQEIGVSGDADDDLGAPRSGRYPMPAIPQTFLDKAFAEALAGSRLPGAPDAAGTALAGSGRPAGLLRQRQLHPGLPDPGEVRRDDPPRSGDRRRGGALRADHRRLRRGRRRSPGHGHPLQALGRQRRPRHGQGLRPRRARDRDAAPAAELGFRGDAERGRRTAPTRSAAT